MARALRAADIAVVEVDRPNRLVRRRQGKSDPLDAVEAARAALSGRACGKAKRAHLCGVAPLEASSGKVVRRRLNRGGDRQANSALWRIALVRMRSDPRTRTNVERRIEEGRSKPEIVRMLKRYIAREVYRLLPRG